MNVQLRHDEVEKTWEDHGFVRILCEGKELAFSEDVQHNRSWDSRQETMEKLVKEALAKLPDCKKAKEEAA